MDTLTLIWNYIVAHWYGLVVVLLAIFLIFFHSTIQAWVDAVIQHGLRAFVSIIARPPLAALIVLGVLITGLIAVVLFVAIGNWIGSIGYDNVKSTIEGTKPFWQK